MTSNERSFPWDDHNGDREYSSDEFAEFFSTLFKPGIVATANFGSGLQITESASLGMRVKFGAGEAFSSFGRNYVHDKDEEVTVPIASTLQDRTDSVAIQFNKSQREAFFVYKESDTTVTRTDSIFELQIAKIVVPKNSTQITNANIIDTRADTKVCGYSSPYESIKTGDLLAQFKSELEANGVVFSDWFENIKGQLSEDAAGHLQNQLDSLDSKVYTAYANSADGTDGFTTVYPNLNLGDNTKTFVGAEGGNNLSGSIRIDPATQKTQDGDFNYLTYKRTTGNADWFKFFLIPEIATPNMTKVAVKPNTKYTFSVLLKGTGQHTIYPYNKWISQGSSQTIDLTSNWTLYTFTVTSSNVIPAENVQFFIRSNAGTEINLKYPKVEEGSTATPYMPSSSEVTTADYPQYKYVGRMTGLNVANKNDPKNYKWQRNTDVVRDQNGDTIFENVEVTGAITQPYISTSFAIGYGLSVTAKRVGNLVTITFKGSNTTTLGSGANPTEKIPLGYRPIEAESVDCLVQGRHLDTYYYFNSDGSISYPGETVPVNSYFRGVRSYFTNDPWPVAV